MKPKAPGARCDICPLASRPCAQSLIPANPVAAVVARSPGWKEAQTGEPFTGLSGKVLNHLLEQNGVKREEVLLTNVVLCSPPEGDVPGEAIKACAPRLQAELDSSGVDLVIAAGREAVNLLVGRGAIDRHRGYRIQQNGRTLIATNNPALVLRDDSTFPNLQKDFRRAFNPIPEPTLPTVEIIEDAKTARAYIESLREQSIRHIAADIESRGGLTHKSSLVTMQFSSDGGTATVFGEREGLWDDQDFLDTCLRPFFESTDHSFIWHNGKFDVKVLRYTYGIEARIDEDTMLQSYACDERSGQSEKQHGGYHKLEYLLAEEFAWPNYELQSVKDFKKTGIVTDYDELHTYAGRDASGTYQLFELLSDRIRSEEVERPYRELLLEGAEACSRIEVAGFRYDVNAAADLMENEVQPELERKTKNMRNIIEDPLLNPRSPKQISNIFYNRWGLHHEMQSRPNMAESTDDATLNELIAGRFRSKTNTDSTTVKTFAKELKRFRELSKQADTYIVALIERAINNPEHRLYTDLLLHGTTSGRLSSRNPNLQNITRTKEGLPDIRRLFLPSRGRVICQSDYCVAPETRILTTDLDWRDAGSLETGESLIGFDEELAGVEGTRWSRYREAHVLNNDILYAPCFRVITDMGMVMVSENHQFAARSGKTAYRRWVKAKNLKPGMIMSYFGKPWNRETSFEAGWLSGFFDGEAHLGNTGSLGFAQNYGDTMIKALCLLEDFGFNPTLQSGASSTADVFFLKGYSQAARFFGMFKPERFKPKYRTTWENRTARGRVATVLALEPLGPREVRAVGTTTRTLITDGFLSHNSQAELRCIAQFSGDSELNRVYREDLDLHGVAAANFYGEGFTSEQRNRAKNMNFGVAYGQGAATFQEKHEIPEREAQKFIDWWWRYFVGVAEWKNEIIKEMKSDHITSPFGRRRRFYLITPENKNAMIREAVNFKPQSTAGDFTLRSVILLAKEIDWKKATIVITVHDNIVGDVKENYVDEYKTMCEQIMVSRPKDELGWDIPFKVDIGVGPNWAGAK